MSPLTGFLPAALVPASLLGFIGLALLAFSVAFVVFGLYLYIAYPDRALFTPSQEERNDMPLLKEGSAPIVGNLPFLAENSGFMIEKLLELAKKHGDTFRLTFGLPMPKFLTFNGLLSQEMITILNPRDVEHVLRDPYTYVKGHDALVIQKPLLGHGIFSSDGDAWSVQRKVASSIFNVRNFRDYYAPVFESDAVKLRGHLKAAHDLGASVDLQDLLSRSTMDSFIHIAVGVPLGGLDVKGYKDEQGHYRLPDVEFTKAFDALNTVIFMRSFSPIWHIEERLSGQTKKIEDWKKTVDSFALRVIADKRKKVGEKGGSKSEGEMRDLLDLFMATKNDDGSELTDEQLRDVIVNFLIAGRDTTAQTVSWVFYNLHSHPSVEKKTREEILTKLPTASEKSNTSANPPLPIQLPSYGDMSKLKYTTALFNEVLRLHSNVPLNMKEATKDDVLPNGVKIRKGDLIQFSPWVQGHLESVWGSDAEEMKPERWISEQGDLIKENQYKWPVFNAGPRICLGMNMATQEAQVLISAILSSFHLELVEEDEPSKWGLYDADPSKRKGRYDTTLTLSFRKGVHFKVHLLNERETE